MSLLDQLYRLQQLDDEIRIKKAQLTDVLTALQVPDRVQLARIAAAEADQKLGVAEQRQRELELQLGSLHEKFKQSHDRLYSGKIKNSRELADLEQELTLIRQRRTQLEEVAFEGMVEVEERQERQQQTAEQQARLEAEWEQREQTLEQEKTELADQLNQLLQQKKRQMEPIEPRVLKLYQDIAKRMRGVAVATLTGTKCNACQMSMSMETSKNVREGQLTRCPNCTRILILKR